jgi:mRNA interferase RelE/StbE
MSHRIVIKRQARQKLKTLPRSDRLRIVDAIDELALDPHSTGLDIKSLAGSDLYRMRVGTWRIIYARDDSLRIISIEKIGARGDVYK